MPAAIQVERDAAGLQTAIRELFEESFAEQRLKPTLDLLDSPEERARVLEGAGVERTLSPGYYRCGAYLLDLGAAIEAGVQYSAGTLTRADVQGLLAVKRARAEFERDHPACPRCGMRQESQYMPKCKCGYALNGGTN